MCIQTWEPQRLDPRHECTLPERLQFAVRGPVCGQELQVIKACIWKYLDSWE